MMIMLMAGIMSISAQSKIGTDKVLKNFKVLVAEMNCYEKKELNDSLINIWKERYSKIAKDFKASDDCEKDENVEEYTSLQTQYRKVIAKNHMNNAEVVMDTIGSKIEKGVKKGVSKVKGVIKGMKK